MLVDSHCHLDFPDFSTELDAVISRARAAGIGRMVTISTRVKRHAQILAIAKHPKVVAIGEAGLDYFRNNSPRDAQEQSFREHIKTAQESRLPLVIHSRDCDVDLARILREESGKGAFPAVLHCFTGGRELAFTA